MIAIIQKFFEVISNNNHNSKPVQTNSGATVSTTPKELPVPKTKTELVSLLARVPRSVLSSSERHKIATIMNLSNITVGEIMLSENQMIFLNPDDFLGPLTLDKLYKSGFNMFPVRSDKNDILGIISTASLNNLEIKEDTIVKDLAIFPAFFVREDYNLLHFLDTVVNSGSQFFLVIDHLKRIKGVITLEMALSYITYDLESYEFSYHDDLEKVAKRVLS